MDKLWAPWRVKYVTQILKKTKGCIFCDILKRKQDHKSYVFIRSQHSYSVLNLYPYNNGHVLIVPNRHVADLNKLKKEEKEDLLDVLETTQALLDDVLTPGGYNIGMNLGKVAGAGFPAHLHIHVVPRWLGDVNFMPVIAHTKVVSQSLDTLYKKLRDAYKKRH